MYKDGNLEHISIPLEEVIRTFIAKIIDNEKENDPDIEKHISDNFEDLI